MKNILSYSYNQLLVLANGSISLNFIRFLFCIPNLSINFASSFPSFITTFTSEFYGIIQCIFAINHDNILIVCDFKAMLGH